MRMRKRRRGSRRRARGLVRRREGYIGADLAAARIAALAACGLNDTDKARHRHPVTIQVATRRRSCQRRIHTNQPARMARLAATASA